VRRYGLLGFWQVDRRCPTAWRGKAGQNHPGAHPALEVSPRVSLLLEGEREDRMVGSLTKREIWGCIGSKEEEV
jgi:hypothetical protein